MVNRLERSGYRSLDPRWKESCSVVQQIILVEAPKGDLAVKLGEIVKLLPLQNSRLGQMSRFVSSLFLQALGKAPPNFTLRDKVILFLLDLKDKSLSIDFLISRLEWFRTGPLWDAFVSGVRTACPGRSLERDPRVLLEVVKPSGCLLLEALLMTLEAGPYPEEMLRVRLDEQTHDVRHHEPPALFTSREDNEFGIYELLAQQYCETFGYPESEAQFVELRTIKDCKLRAAIAVFSIHYNAVIAERLDRFDEGDQALFCDQVAKQFVYRFRFSSPILPISNTMLLGAIVKMALMRGQDVNPHLAAYGSLVGTTIHYQEAARQYIATFGIPNREQLAQLKDMVFRRSIAQEVASRPGNNIAETIDHYDLQSPFRFMVAQSYAISGGPISQNWRAFNVTDGSVSETIARIALVRGDPSLPSSFAVYGITNARTKKEFATKLTETRNIDRYLSDFGIEDSEAFYAELVSDYMLPETERQFERLRKNSRLSMTVAKKIAAESEGRVAEHIQRYGITEQKDLIEIAKVCAQHDESLSIHIKNFGITSKDALIEIAKIAAAKNGLPVIQNIANWGISDPGILGVLAKEAARTPGNTLVLYIDKFAITDKAVLQEIAELLSRVGKGLPAHIAFFGITDQKVLREIAKNCAAHDESLSAHIKNFGIADKDVLFEIAQVAAKKHGRELAEHIQNYGITDQKALEAIAKDAIVKGYPYIENFGIREPSVLKDLALAVLSVGGQDLSRYIAKFAIINPDDLRFLAEQALRAEDPSFAEYFPAYGITDPLIKKRFAQELASQTKVGPYLSHFGIDDETVFYDEVAVIFEVGRLFPRLDRLDQKLAIALAKKAATNPKDFVPKKIEHYTIIDQKERILIAKICAVHDESLSVHIRNFGISDQAALIEIAKIAAAHHGLSLSRNIREYEIRDLDALVEIARIAIKTGYPWIRNFGITDERGLIELAEQAASTSSTDISQYISLFDIKDLEALKQIARLAGVSRDCRLAEYVANYHIQDESDRIEIAKICVTYDVNFAAHVRNFAITNQAALTHLAKVAASMNGEAVACCIHEFGIESPRALEEIAQLAIKEGYQYIQNFGITDQRLLIDLAQEVASRPSRLSASIVHFAITDNKALETIARLAAANGDPSLPENIEHYGIRDQKVLIELAKVQAVSDGPAVAEHIRKYGITDHKALEEIAMMIGVHMGPFIENFDIRDQMIRARIAQVIAAAGKPLSCHMAKFHLEDQAVLRDLAEQAIRNRDLDLIEYFDSYGITDEKERVMLAKKVVVTIGCIDYIGNFNIPDATDRRSIALLCAAIEPHFCRCFARYAITNQEDRFAIIERALAHFPESWDGWRYEETSMQSLQRFPIFSNLCAMLRNPGCSLSVSLPDKSAGGAIIAASFDELDKKISEVKEPLLKKTLENQKRQRLLLLSYALELLKGREMTPLIQEVLRRALEYRNFSLSITLVRHFCLSIVPKHLERYSTMATQVHLKLPMIFLASWGEAKSFVDLMVKERIEFRNAGSAVMQKVLQTLQSLEDSMLSHGQKIALLESCGTLDLKEALSRLVQIQVICALHYEDRLIDEGSDMTKVVVEALQSSGMLSVTGIEDVAAKYLDTFGAMRVSGALSTYLSRLSARDDPSLKEIVQRFVTSVLEGTFREERYQVAGSPHLMTIASSHPALWAEWQKTPSAKPVMATGKKSEIVFEEFLRDKILTHRHAADKMPYLQRFLETHERPAEASEAERLAIELCAGKDPLETLHKLQVELEKGEPLEFLNDVKGLIATMTESSTLKGLTVVDSDNWEDLFLCGTEVLGSCQRIDGDPSLNRGLMGYLMDGKNRLIAVKDTSGKVLARIILRLLWDPAAKRPVLFQERLYPDHCDEAYIEAINSCAKARAEALGCPLFEKSLSGLGETVVSLGSRVPYEYVDAATGIQSNGVYTIRDAVKRL